VTVTWRYAGAAAAALLMLADQLVDLRLLAVRRDKRTLAAAPVGYTF